MKKVLLVGSLLLGNATTTRRIREILEKIDDVALTVVTYTQDEVDAVPLPAALARYHALKVKRVLQEKLEALRAEPYDYVFCITVQPVLALGRLWPKARIIMWFDSLPFHPGSGMRARMLNIASRLMYRQALGRVQTLLPGSKQTRDQIADFSFPSAKQTLLAYIGIDGSRWAPAAPRAPRPQEAKIQVLSVVSNPRGKGILDFFGYAIERRLDLSRFEFSVVTMDTGPELQGLADRLGIRVFRGISHENISELIALYHRADIFFLPSKAEKIPHVLFEAIFAGVPVVTSDVGAVEEVIERDRTGYIVKNLDWQGFYEALGKAAHFPSYDNAEATRRFSLETLAATVAASLQ